MYYFLLTHDLCSQWSEVIPLPGGAEGRGEAELRGPEQRVLAAAGAPAAGDGRPRRLSPGELRVRRASAPALHSCSWTFATVTGSFIRLGRSFHRLAGSLGHSGHGAKPLS